MTADRARLLARRWLVTFAVAAVALIAARIVPDDASDWLLMVAGLAKGPLFGLTCFAVLGALRRRSWAEGYEAAQPRAIPDERTHR